MKTFHKIVTGAIPVAFFAIAAAEGHLYWLAGVMTIVVIFDYVTHYYEDKK
jgi:hypothetical protein